MSSEYVNKKVPILNRDFFVEYIFGFYPTSIIETALASSRVSPMR